MNDIPRDIPHDWIIYSCNVGSFVYNLNTENSDKDIIVIFKTPLNQLISLIPHPDNIVLTNPDRQYFDLKKYLLLLSKSNPNVLETLYVAPEFIFYKNFSMDILLKQRDMFLSKQFYSSVIGSVKSALRYIYASDKEDSLFYKRMMHAIRLLYTGINLFSTNQYQITFTGEVQKFLIDVRQGKYSFSYLIEKINDLSDELDYHYHNNKTLPEKINISKVDILYKNLYNIE